MAKKKLIRPSDDGIQWMHELMEESSDRAAVIVGTAMIDDSLKSLLMGWFCPSPITSEDDLLGQERSLSTLNSRIRISYRLRLIDREFAEALHEVRELRNAYAHWTIAGQVNELHFHKLVISLADKFRTVAFVQEWAKILKNDPDRYSQFLRIILYSIVSVLKDGAKELEEPEPKLPLKLIDSQHLKKVLDTYSMIPH
jgi:hypothetical protein